MAPGKFTNCLARLFCFRCYGKNLPSHAQSIPHGDHTDENLQSRPLAFPSSSMTRGKFIKSLARLFCSRCYGENLPSSADENLAWKPCGVHTGTATGPCTCGLDTLRLGGFDFNEIEEKLRELLLIEEHSQEQSEADIFPKETEISTQEEEDRVGSARIFTNDELQEAIHFFDPVVKLGDGGYGTVYLGKLKDGQMVAIKKLNDFCLQEWVKFQMEVDIFCNLRHQNLICLYGCNFNMEEPALVYEYVSNGTVAEHLYVHSKTRSKVLTWNLRLQIAIETAEAITYLHFKPGHFGQTARQSIIHCDIKTDNILLDDAYHVKVCDFGLSSIYNSSVRGTIGYLDPQYEKDGEDGRISDKSDVYSFGVVLLELISGQMAVDVNRNEIYLTDLALNMIKNKELERLVDSNLEYESDSEIRRMTNQVAELACLCLQLEKYQRPSMAKVLSNLKNIRDNKDPDMEHIDVDYASADSVSPSQPSNYDLSNMVRMNRHTLKETGVAECLMELRSLYGHKLSTLALFWCFVNRHSETPERDTSPWGTSCGCRQYLQNNRILEGLLDSTCFHAVITAYILFLVCLNDIPLHVGQRIHDYMFNLFLEKQKLEFEKQKLEFQRDQ